MKVVLIHYTGYLPSSLHIVYLFQKGSELGPDDVGLLFLRGRCKSHYDSGARCSSVVSTFAHGAMGRRIDPSWGGPIELFLVPASAPRLA